MKSNVTVGEWPENGLESVSKCPVCGSENRTLIHAGMTDRVFFCAPGKWSLYRCFDCQSGYLDPRPTEKSIGIAYQDYFTHQSNTIEFSSLSPANKIRRLLANGYRNWRFGCKHRHASFLGVLAVMLMPKPRRSVHANMRHLPKPKKNQALLDFGCGNGDFLLNAKAAGWDCVGVDFDTKAVLAASDNGLDVREGGIDAIKSIEKQFDVITLSHIIEHVHDPKTLLTACYERLKPNGSLWIETPNLNSQGHGVYGADWRGLEPPRHLVLFNPHSLSRLLSEIGFNEIVHQPETPAIPMVFGESEAIRSGQDPGQEGQKWARKNKRQWRQYERRSNKYVDIREFITLIAKK